MMGGEKMKYTSFRQLDADISELYEAKKYSEALEFMEKELKDLPGEELQKYRFDIGFNRALLHSVCQNYEGSMDAICSLVDDGYAFPLYSRFFQCLKQCEGYEDMREKNDILMEQARGNAKARFEVCLPEGYTPEGRYPLFLSLHGDGGSIGDFKDCWKSGVFNKRGFILAYIQSSRVSHHNAYRWTGDPVKAREDVNECFESVKERYPVDEGCIIIGGFSGGAIASVDITMAEVLPVKGFVCLCPDEKPESVTLEAVKRAADRGVRGVFMEGERMMPVPDEEEMAGMFREVSLPFEYYVNEGAGHFFPEDLDEKLDRALDFVLES
jgi:predicted esterase